MRMHRILVALSVVAMVGAALPAFATSSAGGATFPGRNGKIVFARDTGTPAVYVMNADGTKPKLIAKSGADTPAPSWSADGTKIVYVGAGRTSAEIFVTDANGKHTKQLTKNKVNEGSPTWSPDGRKITYTSFGREIGVWVMNADGTGQTNLTNTTDASEDQATWSPDGTQVAFQSLPQSGADEITINVINADGSGNHALTSTGTASHPNWSPDGTKIVYQSTAGNSPAHVFVMNVDGSNPVDVTATAPDETYFTLRSRRTARRSSSRPLGTTARWRTRST
jgi:Tol biopolymer transport system component